MSNLETAFARLDHYISQRMARSRTPGLALALFDRERCAHVAAYGVADLETQTLVTADTLFEIGSITKSFVAIAVVQAAERGVLDLNAPVTDYLPWFQVQSDFAPITLHHLLTHSAGIVGVVDRSPDPRAAVWALRETAAAWPPGGHFHYSDAGYQTLALVLEKALGCSFPEIIQANIFGPLGMAASEPALTHAMRPRMARGYGSLYDDRPYHASHPLTLAPWIETNAGDCCLASTAEDMSKYGRMLLNRGQGPNGALLSAASFDLLAQQPLPTDWGFAYGYGLEVHQREQVTYIGHGGGMPGYEAFLLLDVANGVGLTLLSTQPSIGIRSLAWTVMELWQKAYLGESPGAVDLFYPAPTRITNAADFAWTYHSHQKTLTLIAADQGLVLDYQGDRIVLERRGTDGFYVNHPHFDRFLLKFGRAETGDGSPGPVVEAFWGEEWYVSDRYTGPATFHCPAEWHGYRGHYRAHIPWQTNFRVVVRKGVLYLIWPSGDEEVLTPMGKDLFCIGTEPSLERLQFSQMAGGQALCANLSGSDYYRFFTP